MVGDETTHTHPPRRFADTIIGEYCSFLMETGIHVHHYILSMGLMTRERRPRIGIVVYSLA